jgi:hypothetical protein
MILAAPAAALAEVASLLHGKLHAPGHARVRRVAELGLLAQLLTERPQPPEQLPLTERKLYDERQANDTGSTAPLSARLVERYGSWKRACYAAWSLLDDGRWTEGGLPWPASPPGKTQEHAYTRDEAIASLRQAAESLGRVPSSTAYMRWRQNRLNRARSRGLRLRLAAEKRITDLLVPDVPEGDRWRAACEVASADWASATAGAQVG